MPTITSIQDIEGFPRAFDAYFQDNFGLRSLLIKGANSIRFHLFQIPPHKRVLLGKEGWLFYGHKHQRDFYQGRNLFTPRDLARLKRIYKLRAEFLKALGVEYVLLAVPSKESLYPEYYNPKYKKISARNRFDQFIDHVANPLGLSLVNSKEHLTRAKKKYSSPLYIKTDSHWNDLGAYEGYRALMRHLVTRFDYLQPVSRSDFIRERIKKRGGFSHMLGVFFAPRSSVEILRERYPDSIRIRAIGQRNAIRVQEQRQNVPLIIDRTGFVGANTIDKAFVYRNSFFTRLLKFFSRHAKIGHYYSTTYFSFDPDLIWKERPQLVIEQFTDHGLTIPRLDDEELLEMGALNLRYARLRRQREPLRIAWDSGDRIPRAEASKRYHTLDAEHSIRTNFHHKTGTRRPTLAKVKVRGDEPGEIELSVTFNNAEERTMRLPLATEKNGYVLKLPDDFRSLEVTVTLIGADRALLAPLHLI